MTSCGMVMWSSAFLASSASSIVTAVQLRQYFPKGTDLSQFSQAYLNKIAKRLNQRPRETLGFETPADRLRAVLQ